MNITKNTDIYNFLFFDVHAIYNDIVQNTIYHQSKNHFI